MMIIIVNCSAPAMREYESEEFHILAKVFQCHLLIGSSAQTFWETLQNQVDNCMGTSHVHFGGSADFKRDIAEGEERTLRG